MAKTKILVVEDETLTAMDIQKTLEDYGYNVVDIVPSGEKAIEITKAKHPDLVLMDIVLAGEIDGIESANQIRKRFGLPVVYLTAYADDDRLKKARFTEPFGYIVKPFKESELHTTIQTALYRHNLERELKDSEERYKFLYRESPTVNVILDKYGKIKDINRWGIENLGYSKEDIIGKYLSSFIVLEQRKKIKEVLRKTITGKLSSGFEADVYAKDSSIHTLLFSPAKAILRVAKQPVGILITGLDITKRKRTEDELGQYREHLEEMVEKRTEELKVINEQLKQEIAERQQVEEELRQYQVMVESAHDSIFYKDLKSRYIIANKRTLDFFGLPREKVIGKDDYKLFKDKTEAKKNIEQDQYVFRRKKPFEIIKKITGVGGRARWFHTIKVPHIDSSGKITGLIGIARDVTERKRAREKLNQERVYYRSFVENMSEWVWEIDKNGIYTYSNPTIQKILGYTVDKIIGHHVTDLWLDSSRTPKRIKWLKDALSSGKGWKDFQCKFKHKDGSARYMEGTAIPIFDSNDQLIGFRGIDRDITERIQMEQALRDSRESFHNIVEKSTEGIAIVDKDGIVRFVNSSFTSMLDRNSYELLGKSLEMPILPGRTTEVNIIKKGVNSGVGEMRVSETEWEGKKAYLATIRDITLRKKIEDEIKEFNEVLELINTILRHDIMNQLTVVKGRCQMLRLKTKDELLDPVLKATNRCVDIIKGMRELESLVSVGKALRPYNVREVVNNTIPNYTIDFNVEGNCMVMADEALDSVFNNIIRNAILHGKTDKIDISIKKKGRQCDIRIADYGGGIPDDIKDKIFEEGFKYGDTGQSGLGLYIVRKVIERYKGKIFVEDNKPKGCVFVIRLHCPGSRR